MNRTSLSKFDNALSPIAAPLARDFLNGVHLDLCIDGLGDSVGELLCAADVEGEGRGLKCDLFSFESPVEIKRIGEFVCEGECGELINSIEVLEKQCNKLIHGKERLNDGSLLDLHSNTRSSLEELVGTKEINYHTQGSSTNLIEELSAEVSVLELQRLLSADNSLDKLPNELEMPLTFSKYSSGNISSSSENTHDKNSHQCAQERTCVIPERFRNKKLPLLDRKIKTGYIKFFDTSKNYGFMSFSSEPYDEVFVFGREFAKANISEELIKEVSGSAQHSFTFKVMYYKGRYGDSKKAVSIRYAGLISF